MFRLCVATLDLCIECIAPVLVGDFVHGQNYYTNDDDEDDDVDEDAFIFSLIVPFDLHLNLFHLLRWKIIMYVTFSAKERARNPIVISQPNCWVAYAFIKPKNYNFFSPSSDFHISIQHINIITYCAWMIFRSISFRPIDVWAIRLSVVLQSSESTRTVFVHTHLIDKLK